MVNQTVEYWKDKVKLFIHDPPDKPLNIKNHEKRAKKMNQVLGIGTALGNKYLDKFASKIQRVTLPGFYGKGKIKYEYKEIIHPLTGKKYEKKYPKLFDTQKIQQLKTDNMKDLFFRLWDKIPELYPQSQILPAETRFPCHSILEHNELTAALHINKDPNNESKIGVLTFKILSPQSLIINSKKWSDLWGSSMLISLLTFEAMKVIIEEYGPSNILFPSIRGNPIMIEYLNRKFEIDQSGVDGSITYGALPHTFTAIIDFSKFQLHVQEICDTFEKFISKLIRNVIDVDPEIPNKDELIDVLKRQIKTTIQFRIAGAQFLNKTAYQNIKEELPQELVEKLDVFFKHRLYDGETISGYYYPTMLLIQNLLAKSPRIPLFGSKPIQMKGVFPERNKNKCDLCGTYTGRVSANNLPENQNRIVETQEKLCGTCLIKRSLRKCYGQSLKTMNLCSVADPGFFKHFYEFTDQSNNKFNLNEFMLKGFDFEWLYLLDSWRKNQDQFCEKFEFVEDFKIKELFKDFDEFLRNKKISHQPNKYYSILKVDGDNMRQLLNGYKRKYLVEYFPETIIQEVGKRSPDTIELIERYRPLLDPPYQKFFSNALNNFSSHIVPSICNEEQGSLIYSGGDDILALFPPNTVCNAAVKLNQKFGQDFLNDNEFGLGEIATLSGSIIIVHTKYPMPLALKEARRLEEKAKDYFGRSCITIAIIKHSGRKLEGVLYYEAIPCFHEIIKIFIQEKISQVFFQLLYTDHIIFNQWDLYYDEFIRILSRRKTERTDWSVLKRNISKNLKNAWEIYKKRLAPLECEKNPLKVFSDSLLTLYNIETQKPEENS